MWKKANEERAFQKKLAVQRWENEGGGVPMPLEKNRTTSAGSTKDMGEINDKSIQTQVEEEFEAAEELGRPDMEQIENELNEPDFILQSPENSREDVAFENINVDERGAAFGIENDRDEPLQSIEQIEERDDDRWSMTPESAEDFHDSATADSNRDEEK